MKNKNNYSIPNVGKYTMEPALDRFYFVTFQPQKRPSRSNPLPNQPTPRLAKGKDQKHQAILARLKGNKSIWGIYDKLQNAYITPMGNPKNKHI